MGGGPEEYSEMWAVMYDEATETIFVQSPTAIMGYSLTGEFKRRIPLLEGSLLSVRNFDAESFILFDMNSIYPTPFSLISKKDGSILESIDLPPIDRIPQFVSIPASAGSMFTRSYLASPQLIRHDNGFLLDLYTSDTVFVYRDRELSPFLVRTPNIRSMDPMVILEYFIEAGDYQFLDMRRLQYAANERVSIPLFSLVRNEKTESMYRPIVTFDEYRGKEVAIGQAIAVRNTSRLGLINLDLTALQEANSEGRLSGRLKEIVDNSEEDGNNVFMLLHFK